MIFVILELRLILLIMQNIDKKMINKETVNMDNIINIRYKLGYGFMIRIKRMVFS